jgi:heme/copper-type cytochrome/quinol oxidase subunit 2
MQPDTLAYDTLSRDTLAYDTLESRPLPKWLVDQKEGLTTIQPEKIIMREDHSLKISFVVTAIFILVLVAFLTFYFIRKQKKQA